MRRWAFLLRPGWLALFVVVVAFAYLCFTVLAPWQLGKNTKTSRENGQISRSLTAPPVPVTSVLPQQDSSAPDEQWQRVTATGRYLADNAGAGAAPGRRGRSRVRGAGAVRCRRRPDGARRPRVREARTGLAGSAPSRRRRSGTVTITARLRDSEQAPEGKAPFRQDGDQQVYSIDTAQIAGAGRRSAGGVISAAGRGSAGRPRRDRVCRTWMPARSCPMASSGSRSASSRQSGWATS